MLPVCCLLIGAGVARGADDARAVFDGVYGDELKRVRATADGKDDLAMAEKLIDAAAKADSTKLIALCCNAAFDLAEKQRTGGALAVQAMRVLLERAPGEALEARGKLVAVLRKQFNAARPDARGEVGQQLVDVLIEEADEHLTKGSATDAVASLRVAASTATAIKSPLYDTVKAKLDAATARQVAEAQAARISEKVKVNPGDAAAHRDLARLYLVEFDNPTRAAPHAEKSQNETYRKLAPLAGKSVDQVSAGEALELAEWYRGLASEALTSAAGKVAMLRRAETCYQRFLSENKEAGLHVDKAKLALTETTATLAKLQPAGKSTASADPKTTTDPKKGGGFDGKLKVIDEAREITPEDGHVDLSNLVNPRSLRARGRWTVVDGKLHGGDIGYVSTLTLPFATSKSSYEMEIRFERVGGEISNAYPSMCMMMPAANGELWAIVGSRRDRSGFEGIRGKGIDDDTYFSSKVKFDAKKVYTVVLAAKSDGDKAQLLMQINGKVASEWKGPASELPNPGEGDKLFHISTHGQIIVHRIAIRMVEGTLKPAR